MKILKAQERRANPRIRTVHLTAKLSRRGWLGRLLPPRDAAVLDFSRQGVLLCSDSRYCAGDRVELQLQSSAEHIRGIRGTVRHVLQERGEYSLGIEFDAQHGDRVRSSTQSRSNILDRMEQVVEHQLA